MNHPEIEAKIDAELDGELAPSEAAALEAHLSGCAECRRFRAERTALRSAIAAEVPGYRAPESLERRVRGAIREASAPRGAPATATPRFWRPLAIAASLMIVALGSWRLGTDRAAARALADDVLASHIRSLMPGHLTDVLSSDQHTVKPWFNGKLDFSPPVRDLAERGYPLLGGRLDYVDGRPAAALVYGRRQHVINVFVWPVGGPDAGAAESLSRGYNLLHWTTPQYSWWAASDLALPELREFVSLLQRGDSASATP
jgi:anti-sigma factor RsiW